MDVFVRFPLIFMTDVMISNRACFDLFPGFHYLSSLLPMDPVHMFFMLVILTYIVINVKKLPILYQFTLFWLMYDLVFYALHWIISYPENYFPQLLLKFLIISVGAYAIKRFYGESELVMLMAALFLYLYLEEDPSRMENYAKFALLTTLIIITMDDDDDDDEELKADENIKQMSDFSGIVFKRMIQKFAAYWMVIVVVHPLTCRFCTDFSRWNLWNGVFVEGMDSPVRVCAMTALLLLLTYYAFDLFKMLGFGKYLIHSMGESVLVTAHFFAFVLDDRVWDLEPEKRAEFVQNYFFIHLVLFLDRCYYDFGFYLFYSDAEEEENNPAVKKKLKAILLCFFTFIIAVYLFYFAGSTLLALNVRSVILFTSLTCLVLKMSVDVAFNFALDSPWFYSNYDVAYWTRIFGVINKCILYGKKLVVALCMLWLTVFRAVRASRVLSLYDFVTEDLVSAREVYRKYTQPAASCIRSLPRATTEQLAVNDDVCLTCHEDMEEACVTPCNHYYRPGCLRSWLDKDNKCPLCQTVLYNL